LQVAAEGLLDHHPRIGGAAGFSQILGNGGEQARWNGQIMERPLCVAQFLAQLVEGVDVVVVAVDVP
jgi:hypothetical protein